MPDPYDYTSAFANLPSPGDSFLAGLRNGIAMQDVQAQQQQKQAALLQQQQMQADLQALSQNPTPAAIGTLMVKYPALSEQLKRASDVITPVQQQAHVDHASQVYAAVMNGQPDIAEKLLTERAAALRNSGNEHGAAGAETFAKMVHDNPAQAKTVIGMQLASAMGPDKFAQAFKDIGGEKRADELQGDLVRKGKADANAAESDLALKNLGIVAQKAGALAKPGVKPSQAQTMFRTLAAQGVIPKEELQGYLDGIPADPKALPDYLRQVQAAGMTSKDQMAYTTPDANTVANNATQVKTTGMNNATQLKVQDRIDARQESQGNAEPSLDAETLTTMAQQYLAGDKSVMQNLGRGAQGSANIVALRQAITQEAKAKGMTGPQIAAAMADYQGMTAGLRTSANISARVENAISEAKELAPLAIEAGRNVARSGFLPFGKVGVMFDTQTNDPALKKFATANNGLVSAYAGAMARGQKPTVSDYDHAREILAAAQSQAAYEATVNQMFAEMDAASRAPKNVREHLRGEIGGAGAHASPAGSAPAIPAGWSVREH